VIKSIINQPLAEGSFSFTFDAFTATLISPKFADFPCHFDEKSPERSIVQLVEYLRQEIQPFDNFVNRPTKPYNGYTRATAFIDQETGSTAFTVLYGGKSQNGTICVQTTGAYADTVWPVLARHFEMKVTRLDSAFNYLGAYWPVQKLLARLSKSMPSHVGNEITGHTHYFGSRSSPSMIRHYEYGKCHYPNQPATHRENRVEVEWKPQDKKQQLQAQELTAEQVFLRSTLGQLFYENVAKTLVQPVKLQTARRVVNTDIDEKLAHIAITYKNTLQQKLLMVGGDFEQFSLDLFSIIEEHEKRGSK
jgi:DNA relaxase NicK